MPLPRRIIFFGFLTALDPLSLSLRATENLAPTPAAPVIVEKPKLNSDQIKFTAARNGAEVLLSWQFPDDYDVRFAELLRNTQRESKGRDRVGPVSIRSGKHADQTPDATVTYWYWLKVALKNGQTLNIGPIATPAGQVWQPAQ